MVCASCIQMNNAIWYFTHDASLVVCVLLVVCLFKFKWLEFLHCKMADSVAIDTIGKRSIRRIPVDVVVIFMVHYTLPYNDIIQQGVLLVVSMLHVARKACSLASFSPSFFYQVL